jgi:hypothetical protein
MAGLEDWIGLHWIIAVPVAYFVAYIPFVGTLVGIFGAITAWNLSLLSASALFLGPFAVLVVLGIETGMFTSPGERSGGKSLSVSNVS